MLPSTDAVEFVDFASSALCVYLLSVSRSDDVFIFRFDSFNFCSTLSFGGLRNASQRESRRRPNSDDNDEDSLLLTLRCAQVSPMIIYLMDLIMINLLKCFMRTCCVCARAWLDHTAFTARNAIRFFFCLSRRSSELMGNKRMNAKPSRAESFARKFNCAI